MVEWLLTSRAGRRGGPFFTGSGRRVTLVLAAVGQAAERVVVVVERQADLLEVIRALHAIRRLADLLDGGQEQANEDRDDGDDDEQLDQGEAGPASADEHGGLRGAGVTVNEMV